MQYSRVVVVAVFIGWDWSCRLVVSEHCWWLEFGSIGCYFQVSSHGKEWLSYHVGVVALFQDKNIIALCHHYEWKGLIFFLALNNFLMLSFFQFRHIKSKYLLLVISIVINTCLYSAESHSEERQTTGMPCHHQCLQRTMLVPGP